jgi:hypothetical protein
VPSKLYNKRKMFGVLLIVFGRLLMGWCDYFEINGRKDAGCVCIRCFHIFGMPIFPLEAMVILDPSPSVAACCGKARAISFKSYCNKWVWKAFGWAWLRFLCFGLLACYHPQCSDTTAIMEAVGINDNRNQAAAAAGDNKQQYLAQQQGNNYNSFTPQENEAPRQAGDTTNAI